MTSFQKVSSCDLIQLACMINIWLISQMIFGQTSRKQEIHHRSDFLQNHMDFCNPSSNAEFSGSAISPQSSELSTRVILSAVKNSEVFFKFDIF
jgi:hypothetical protein